MGDGQTAMLAAYRKVAGDTRKLLDRQYSDAKSVNEAGDVAFECGQVSQILEHLEQYKPVLNGQIRFRISEGQVSGWHHLYNKMVQGFASSGGIKNESDAVACAALLVNDEHWVKEAERVLMKASVPLLRSPSAVIDFMANLKSERAVETMKVVMTMPQAGEPKK